MERNGRQQATAGDGEGGENAGRLASSRRSFLAGTVGVLGVGSALGGEREQIDGGLDGGGGGSTTETVPTDVLDEYGDRFGTVVDVTEAGGDPTGTTPVNDVLEEHVGDDTLLYFPAGTYLMTRQLRKTGYTNLGFLGPEATIVHGRIDAVDGNGVTDGEFTGPARLFRLGVNYNPGTNLLFEGFTFDYTGTNSGLRAIEAYVTDGLEVRDITVAGQHDTGTLGPALFSIRDAEGSGVVERFSAPDGAKFSEDTIGNIWVGPTGVLVDPQHAGTLRFVDCELGMFPDNGLYISGAKGTVHVEGGTYRNSNVASIRLQGYKSTVRGATVVVDDALPDRQQRGIRLDKGAGLAVIDTTIRLDDPSGEAIRVLDGVETASIENSTVVVNTDRSNRGIHVATDAGRVKIVNTDIEINGSDNAVRILGRNAADDAMVLLKGVSVTGSASGETAREAIRVERANCRLDDLTVHQPGAAYRRCVEVLGDDCLVIGGTYESTHHPIINKGSRTVFEGITAQSLDGFKALKLYEQGSPVYIANSVLYGGYVDKGVATLAINDTTFPPN
jgi:hypothetical protein